MKRIKTKGKQIFSVPNTKEGQEFIKLMRKFANYGKWNLRVKGRSKDRDAKCPGVSHLQSTMPLDKSEWLAVYPIDKSTIRRNIIRSWK